MNATTDRMNAAQAKPEEVMVRVLGTTGFALGLLLTISTLLM